MPVLAKILIASLASGVLSLLGGVALLARPALMRRFSIHLLSFAVGALFATAFSDLLPEGVELAGAGAPSVFWSAAAGVFLFFSLERLMLHYHSHYYEDDDAGHSHPAPLLLQVGDTIHNFIDGVAVAIGFLVNPGLGVLTAVAVAAHELPQEIGDFSVLLHHGWSRGRALAVNLLSSLVSVGGAALAYAFRANLESVLPQLLGFTAGIFIYIAGADLVPEVSRRAPRGKAYHAIFWTLLGLLAVTVLRYYLE